MRKMTEDLMDVEEIADNIWKITVGDVAMNVHTNELMTLYFFIGAALQDKMYGVYEDIEDE